MYTITALSLPQDLCAKMCSLQKTHAPEPVSAVIVIQREAGGIGRGEEGVGRGEGVQGEGRRVPGGEGM